MQQKILWAAAFGSAAALATMATGCGSDAASTTAAADTKVSDTAVADSGTADSTSDSTSIDTTKADSKADASPLTCAQAAGGWAVSGTCSNGGDSIPYACMKVKDCTLTWEADFRQWTGTLAGADYHLSNTAGTETIDGHFDSNNAGSYTFATKGLTCDATMVRFSSTLTDQLCCDVVAQDCQEAGQACVPILDSDSGTEIVTTGCLDVATNATATVGAACGNGVPLACGKGMLCIKPTGAGSSGQGTCTKLCVSAGDCSGSQSCVIASGAPRSGVCEAACTPLASSNTCGDGQFCGPAAISDSKGQRVMGGACAVAGTGKLGDKCSGSGQCPVDAICASGKCAALCDGAHSCNTGTCKDFGLPLGGSVGAGFGFCAE